MVERVVIDTNVWISGLLWRGKAYRCLMLARTGFVQAVYCPSMAAELTEKLRGKFRYSEHEIRAVVHDLNRIAIRFEISGSLRVIEADPDDDKFIECAVVAGATAVVSEDHHLLQLGRYREIEILSSAGLLKRLAETPNT